ncbi:MAG: tetratricopeptide repeat protein [Candidatus Melainabacteria bacterium]|jgi:tetratricopeptide (TPR) repeat protein|nr:tetratricopeptide repeat protein [Candidatus Melainabacteria bacterium]
MSFHIRSLKFNSSAIPSSNETRSSSCFSKALAALLCFSLPLSYICAQPDSEARAARRASSSGGGGGGGGGVMLSTPNPTNPLEHNNRAVELGSKGLWADAIREHEIALEGDPYNEQFKINLSGACLRYGDMLASRKKYYEAMVQYRKALFADPANAVADKNLDECLKASGKNPDDAEGRRKIAEAAEVEGRFRTAQVEYRKVCRMTDDGSAHADLARSLYKDGQDVAAFEELKIAVNKPWKDKIEQAKCHTMLGDLLWKYAKVARDRGDRQAGLKRLQNAAISYRRAVTLNPSYSDAIQGLKEVAREAVSISGSFDNHLMLAGAYQLSGDFEHAKMEFEEAWKKSPNSPALAKARRSYYVAVVINPTTPPAVLANVMTKLEDLLKQNNQDAEILFCYGRGKESQGDRETAMRAYRAAASINPHIHPDLLQGISRLGGGPAPGGPVVAGGGPAGASAAAPGGKPGAAPVVPAAAPAAPILDPRRFAAAEGKMASGDSDGAQKELNALIDKDPKDGEAWLRMGRVNEKKGNLDEASASYRMSFNLGTKEAKDAMNQVDLSRIQNIKQEAEKAEAAGNWIVAASSWKEACTLAPHLPLPFKSLAVCLQKMGDSKEAEKVLKKLKDIEKE